MRRFVSYRFTQHLRRGTPMKIQFLSILSLVFLATVAFGDGQDFKKANWNCDSLSHGTRIAIDSVGKNLWRVPLDHAGNPVASQAVEYVVDDFKVYRCQGCFDIVAHAPRST